MLTSQLKPKDEVLGYLQPGERVFLVACAGCAEVCQAGGEEAVASLRSLLTEAGRTVVGGTTLPFACNKALVGMRLARLSDRLGEADSLLVAACGVGIQAVSQVADMPVHPASDTTTTGQFQGIWPSEERCARCGECLLEYTGGICPLTCCPKGLLHGPCGGSHGGECEVEPGRPCGWQRIHDRLERQGRLDLLSQYRPPKDRRLQLDVPLARRRSLYWALETLEED
ncbi:MAG: methylenetetrahydrofolate reductase C-terminal domain-containing protein [Candidatus Bipolaricaulaceae bacterium]